MIHELRIYTVRQGTLADMMAAGALSRTIRGDDYGKLEGYWATDIGPLNQVVHLWTYKDLNERMRLREELGKNERFIKEYIPLGRAPLVRQQVRFLTPVAGVFAPDTTPNVYELRTYRTKPGAARRWCDLIMKAMPAREKYSKLVGLWITEAGEANEVCHIWVYKDLNERQAARTAVAGDPVWQQFLKDGAPLLEDMHSTIMLPAPFSPLK